MMDIIAWLQMHVLQEDYYQFYAAGVFILVYFEYKFRKVIQAWNARDADTEPRQ